jgi:ankyrin repeat protein
MSTRSLPSRPNLDQLKRQAHELHRAHRAGKPSAAARIVAHHPRLKGQPLQAVLDKPITLADAQLVLAREYGLESWARLKQRVEIASRVAKFTPHPRFDDAVAAMDYGDLDRLRRLITSDPTLVQARTNLDPPYGYFTAATLLHHVAGNPSRGRLSGQLPPLPQNSAGIARLLLDAGADVMARTLGPHGGTTMGLLITSKQASDANVTGPLIDVLLAYGAKLDVTSEDALDGALANHAPRAAEKMIELGAKGDVLAAAALGRMDWLRTFFDSEGLLRSRPRRNGQEMPARDAIGLALLYAYVREQRDAVEFLLDKDANWNMTGVNNGTILHRAAWDGDLAMVQRLVAKGADISNRDNPFNSTPLSWAQHNKQDEVFEWMRTHCAIDLHDAVGFGLREHVEARLREDPASINMRRDHWDIPQCTPLHWAAWVNIENVDGVQLRDPIAREQLVKLLLDHGAAPNIVAGNGLTPLDVAEAAGPTATGIVALLKDRGARRAADL